MSIVALSYVQSDFSYPMIGVHAAGGTAHVAAPLGQDYTPLHRGSQMFMCGSLTPYVPGWSLIRPLPVTVQETAAGEVIISESVFLVYGVGRAREEAMADLAVSLVEYYGLVERGAAQNNHDQQELRQLQQYLRGPQQ